MAKTIYFSLRLSEEQHEDLIERAKKAGLPKSTYICRALGWDDTIARTTPIKYRNQEDEYKPKEAKYLP